MTDQDAQETCLLLLNLLVFRRSTAGLRHQKPSGRTIVTLKPSTEFLASLGAAAQITSILSFVSPDSAYGKLPRPATWSRFTYSAND
jgi:phytoene/squalene synthetase